MQRTTSKRPGMSFHPETRAAFVTTQSKWRARMDSAIFPLALAEFSVFTENRERGRRKTEASPRRVRLAMGRARFAMGDQPDDGADPCAPDDGPAGDDHG